MMRRLLLILFLLAVGMLCRGQLPQVHLCAGQLSEKFSSGIFSIGDGRPLRVEVRYRGASSLKYAKKSFALKLMDNDGAKLDTSLLGMREDNSWVLDAMAIDLARMRNRVSTDLWNDFSSPSYIARKKPSARNGTEGRFVELWLNGQYHGLYCLTEKVDRRLLKLKKKDGGVMHGAMYKSVTHSLMWSDDPSYFDHQDGAPRWAEWEFAYPDPEEDPSACLWLPFVTRLRELGSLQPFYTLNLLESLIDVPVWVDYYLLCDLLCAEDNVCKNQYVYFYDVVEPDCLMGIAPWDMDHSWGRDYKGRKTSPSYYISFEYNNVSSLIDHLWGGCHLLFRQRYRELRSTFFQPDELVRRFDFYFNLFRETGAAERETARWNGVDGFTLNFRSEQAYIASWIRNRIEVLDEKYGYEPIPVDFSLGLPPYLPEPQCFPLFTFAHLCHRGTEVD